MAVGRWRMLRVNAMETCLVAKTNTSALLTQCLWLTGLSRLLQAGNARENSTRVHDRLHMTERNLH